jgi:integrase
LRKRGAERAKTRTLTDDEIRLFWHRVIEPPIPSTVGLALRLVLAAGVRPGEAAGMARSELEFDERGVPTGWTIPAARSKNRRAHFVPLSPLARDVIVEAMALNNNGALIFAARNYTLAVAMARLATVLAGVESWKADPPTPHDLRRTTATKLAAAGVPGEDVSAILGHVRTDVTGKHYDMYRRADEKRRALDRWSRILKSIIEPTPASVVVVLRS